MLSYYASRLPAVELNKRFYRTPEKSVIESWKAQVPENFRFSVKAPQMITHFKRLNDVAAETRSMLRTFSMLEDRLGVILFQLPPNMKKDLARLKTFLKKLPADIRTSWEFRHPSWFDDEVLALLRSQNRALCIADTVELPATHIDKTADWGYLRLRRVKYKKSDLVEWSNRIQAQDWQDAYVFFKHEDEGTGPKLAARLLALNRCG